MYLPGNDLNVCGLKKLLLIYIFTAIFTLKINAQDSLKVERVFLIPLKYYSKNFVTFADSTGIYVKIISPIFIAELEKLLNLMEVWLNYHKVFKP